MDLPARVLASVRKFGMVPSGGRVLVAVSGGSDSVALVHLLRQLQNGRELTVAGLAHLNHGLRPAAAADEEFCRRLAGNVSVPFCSETQDIRRSARLWNTSLEDAGRRARYAFFGRVAAELGADVVATGHTKNDQAETFLLRLIRGSGPRGLTGIKPRAGTVVRPLIEIERAELRSWLAERSLDFREDETNLDLTIPRNRVRHELIPYLQREFSPGIVDVLAREASIAGEDEDHLQQTAIELARTIVLLTRDSSGFAGTPPSREDVSAEAVEDLETVEMDADALRSAHPAVAARVARIALSVFRPSRPVGFEDIRRLLALASSRKGSAVSLPGQHARRHGEKIVLRRAPWHAFANSFRFPLSIPGEVVLDAHGWAVSAATTDGDEGPSQWPLIVPVQAARLREPLAVRSRQRGDRFRPAGLGGHRKKLQDFFVDQKVPRETRDSLPLVVDADDRIVWIVGQAVAEDFRLTDESQGVIFLKARRLGGLG
jgi:tRNA(Ile)-lysidine synthase